MPIQRIQTARFLTTTAMGRQIGMLPVAAIHFRPVHLRYWTYLFMDGGEGEFTRSEQVLLIRRGYASTPSVAVGDMTGNGQDLFVGERLQLFSVGLPAADFSGNDVGQGILLKWEQWASVFFRLGSTDAVWTENGMSGRSGGCGRVDGSAGIAKMRRTWKRSPWGRRPWHLWLVERYRVQSCRPERRRATGMVLGNHGLNSQFHCQMGALYACGWYFDGNGIIEQMLSTAYPKGNYPIAGPYDASYGVVLGVDEGGQLYSYPPAESGFRVDGAIRAIGSVTTAGGDIRLVIARNNNSSTIYKLKQ